MEVVQEERQEFLGILLHPADEVRSKVAQNFEKFDGIDPLLLPAPHLLEHLGVTD